MSAWIVTRDHLDLLLTAALAWHLTPAERADKTGRLLWKENCLPDECLQPAAWSEMHVGVRCLDLVTVVCIDFVLRKVRGSSVAAEHGHMSRGQRQDDLICIGQSDGAWLIDAVDRPANTEGRYVAEQELASLRCQDLKDMSTESLAIPVKPIFEHASDEEISLDQPIR